jgi:hypothetical protein
MQRNGARSTVMTRVTKQSDKNQDTIGNGQSSFEIQKSILRHLRHPPHYLLLQLTTGLSQLFYHYLALLPTPCELACNNNLSSAPILTVEVYLLIHDRRTLPIDNGNK